LQRIDSLDVDFDRVECPHVAESGH
jgi:hypothetical protein